jgi:anthranilate phosphoribosyltransferase
VVGLREEGRPGLAEVGGWSEVLTRLIAGEDLSPELAAGALRDVLLGEAGPARIAAFVMGLRSKGETIEEMSALLETMLEFAEPLALEEDVVDTCGSGGDRSMTINVSTIAALVAAGAGAAICKHGGRAASSVCGSADVLEALGVVVDLGPSGVARCVSEARMGFCFAPTFHPAMRHAAPVRKELGVPTVFNFLGPLANPARARRQVVGVSDPKMADKMVGVLAAKGSLHAMVVHGHDGLDELSTVAVSTVREVVVDREGVADLRVYEVDPTALGLSPASLEELRGGDAGRNADALRRVLAGDEGPQRDIAVLNAAAALVVADLAADLVEGIDLAGVAIDRGEAARVLDRLVATSQAARAAHEG